MIDLSVNIGSWRLRNPVMVASGTFGYADEFKDFFDLNRLGAIVTKLNSIGLPNVGVDRFIREKMPFLRTLQTPIVVNVAGKTAEGFVRAVARLEEVDGIAAYELNYSCPNVKEGGLAFSSDAGVAESLTRDIRRVTRRPIIAKLTPNVTSIAEIGRAVENGGADAVSAINTLVGMAVDVESRRPKLSTITGGLSGPAIKPVALAKVWELINHLSIPVIGIGGIETARDALEFLLVGAVAVQVGTANFINPRAALDVLEGIESFCEAHQIKVLSDFIGGLETGGSTKIR